MLGGTQVDARVDLSCPSWPVRFLWALASRVIVANLADDDYIGHQAYWKTAVETSK
jgi:hypothetical protein